MDLDLKIGIFTEKEETVSGENVATKYGSGGIEVYATPAMVRLMENAALSCVDELLPKDMATVGTRLDIKHLAATPIGMKVQAKAELIEVDGKRLVFKVEAFDEKEKIGEGIHERYIVNIDKFKTRVEGKK